MAGQGWRIVTPSQGWRIVDDPMAEAAAAVSTATLPAPKIKMEPAFGNPIANVVAASTRINPTVKAGSGTAISGEDHIKADAERRRRYAAIPGPKVPLPAPVMPEEESKLDVPMAAVTPKDVRAAADLVTGTNPLLIPGRIGWKLLPESVQSGVEKSVAKNLNMLTTPRNAAIAGGLAAANAAAAAFPPALPFVQALNATAGTYFGAEMLGALPDMNRAYQERVKEGDVEGATEALTDIAAAAAGSATATGSAVPMLRRPIQARTGTAPVEAPALAGSQPYAPDRYWVPGDAVDMGVRPIAPPEVRRVVVGKTRTKSGKKKNKYATDVAVEPAPPMPGLPGRGTIDRASPPNFNMAAQAIPDAPTPASAQIRPSVSLDRAATQKGAIPFLPNRKPTTPADTYIKEYVEARETARKGAVPSFKEKVGQLRKDFVGTMVDDKQIIVDYVKKANPGVSKNRANLTVADEANYWIDRAINSDTVARAFTEKHGLDRIVRGTKNLDALDQYMLARHARDIEAAGFESGRNLAKDAAIIDQYENAVAIPATRNTPARTYRDIGQQVTAAANELLDEAVASGLVSEKAASIIKQLYPNYIPIGRIFTAIEEGTIHPDLLRSKGTAGVSKQTIVRALKGSDREMENPLVSFYRQVATRTKQIAQNNAGRFLVETIEASPNHQSILKPHNPKVQVAPGMDILSVYRDGRKYTYEIPAELAAAAKNLNREQMGRLWHWAVGAPMRLMKFGTTGASAPFAAMNVAVDLAHSYIAGMFGPIRGARTQVQSMPAALRALAGGPLARELHSHGGGFISTDILRNPSVKSLERIRSGRSVGARAQHILTHPVGTVGELFRTLENVIGKSEEFGRFRMYDSVKKELVRQGWKPEEAAMKAAVEANNSLPNYMRAGSVGRVLNMVLPYFNPSIQGQRSWMKNFRRGDKTYKAGVAARIGAAVFLPQAAATLWNLADENRRRAYNDIRDFDKSNNMLMVLDGNETDGESRKHNVVRIKLEPGLVKASNVVRQALEAHYGNMDPVEWDDVAKGLIGMVSPVGVEGNEILSSIIPQTIKPEVQAAANYNLFRDQPIETPSMQRVLKEDRRYPWTSQTAGLIGNAVGVSPVKTEQYLYDRFGGIATQALNAADNVLAATGVIEKSQVGGVNPIQAVAERFTVARGGALEGRVYEAKAEMKRALASSYANKIKSDPEFKRLSGEDQMRAMRTAVSRANSQVEALDKHEGLAQLPIDQQVRVYEAIRADLLKSLAANN